MHGSLRYYKIWVDENISPDFQISAIFSTSNFECLQFLTDTHYSKSQTFVQKFNFDKTPTFSRVFHPNFFDNFSREIKVVNS